MPIHEDGRPRRPRADAPPPSEANINVARTAFITARMRPMADFPLTDQIYELAAARWAAAGNPIPDIPEPHRAIPSHEIRTILTDRLIAETGNTQVLDLGAGLMHRGAFLTDLHRILPMWKSTYRSWRN